MAFNDNQNSNDPSQFESALALLGLTGLGANDTDPTEAFNEAESVAGQVYANRPTELSTDERRELNSLRNEFQKLMAPQMETQPIGRLIPGNEFSTSTAGLSQGLSALVRGRETKRRKDALFGDPERRAELQQKIEDNKSKISEIQANAQKIRNGIIPAENLARLDPMASAENVAQSVEEQATALQEEIDLYEAQLEQTQGVAARTKEAEEKAQRVDQNRQSRNNFVESLGADIYGSELQAAENEKQRQSMERRTMMQQLGATERTRIQQKRIYDTQTRKINDAINDSEVAASEFTPGQYKPDLIRQISHDVIKDIESEIDLFKQRVTAPDAGAFGEEKNFGVVLANNPGLERQYTELLQGKQHVEMIMDAADTWKERTFTGDREPNWRPPSELEIELYDQMLDNPVIHPEMVQAWLHYNEIDPAAPPTPLENPNKRQPGMYIFSRDQY